MRTARADSRRCCPFRRSTRHPRGMVCAAAAVILFAAPVPAPGQTWEFRFSSDTLSPEAPSTTMTLWAHFPPGDHAFALAEFDVRASETGWDDWRPVQSQPGQRPGELSPDGREVVGILVRQLSTPGGFVPKPDNPIDVWEATFTAMDFTAREVSLTTLTKSFEVYLDEFSSLTSPRTPIDIETTIRVIPAPAPLALLGLGALVAGRPRRNGRSAE